MPRHITRGPSRSPHHEKFVKKLAQELKAPGIQPQPLVLEEEIPATGSRHVHVIWDQWKKLSDEERSSVIADAYVQAEGEAFADQITIASGLTPAEAQALGLLPWRVVHTRKRQEARPPLTEYRKALESEARNTVLGPDSQELRFARAEDAEAARQRLEKALPGSRWIVEKEVQYE